jgi:16S rRNA G966 N2-methylase RsmD
MKIEIAAIDSIKPYVNNPRINDNAINKVANSIKEFGFRQPIVVDKDRVIIAGHTRHKAALQLGLKEVPITVADNLTKAQIKGYRLADNRAGQEASWNTSLLSEELLELKDLDFDLSLTAFDVSEINDLLNPDQIEDEDFLESSGLGSNEETVTCLGDVWLLDKHRLMCADSRNIEYVEKLINNNNIEMVFTDPPYGIDENTDRVSSKRTQVAKAGVYEKIIGDLDTSTAIDAYNLCESLKIPIMVFWGANYYAHSLPESGNWLVWDKRISDEQRDSNSDCELAWIKSRFNSVRIFRHLWKGMIKGSENGQGRVHPTQKPTALAEWCFDEYGKDVQNILDLFGGSGSTLIACENKNKICFLMELSPEYCDVIINRWQKHTGKKAILESSGKSFYDLQNKIEVNSDEQES